MAVRVAVSTWSLERWRRENGRSLDDALRWLADEGVAGVEFAGLDEAAIDAPFRRAEQLKTLCDALRLSIAGYCVGGELLTRSDAERAAAVATLKGHVDVAAALGAMRMRHDVTAGPSDDRPMSWAAVLDAVTPSVASVADHAMGKGVRTSVENHGFYLQTADRIEGLVRAVNHPNFAITLDMGNFLCLNQDPVAAVRQLARYASIVHAKDFHVRPKDRLPGAGWFATPTTIGLRGAILGHGAIDVPAQLEILRDAKYDGWISLEFEGMEEPTMGVRLGLEYLRKQIAAIGL